MSELKVNKISPRSGTTVTLGDSGDTFTIPSGVTLDASSGGLAGTLTTAAQPNITSVGTLTSFTSTGIDDNATSTAITIDSSGNLGIGTSSPSAELHISKSADAGNAEFLIENSFVTAGSTDEIVQIQGRFGGFDASYIITGKEADFTTSGNRSSFMSFWTRGAGTLAEAMRIDSSGNVGVNTSSPNNYSGYGNITLNGSTGGILDLSVGNTRTGSFTASASSVTVQSRTAIPLIFETSASEKMRINSNGNIGIGTTNSTTAKVYINHEGDVDDNGLYVYSNIGQTVPLVRIIQDGAGSTAPAVYIRNDDADGIALHLYKGSSSITPPSFANALFIEDDDNTGITIGSPTDGVGSIVFGDSGDNDIAKFQYYHSDNSMRFTVNTSEAMRITSNNQLLIGTTVTPASANTKLRVHLPINTSSENAIQISHNTNGANKAGAALGLSIGNGGEATNAADLTFHTASGGSLGERMRITSSGNVLVGTTSLIGDSSRLNISYNFTNSGVGLKSNTTSTHNAIMFTNPNGTVGTITTSGSSTAYNTSSDYRLKENVSYDFDATTRLKQLKPARFNFIADADTTVDGFLAHEVSSVVPEAITGEKDAMKTEEYEVTPAVLDEDGNVITEAVMGTREVPDYQGIDQSKLVPLLVKTIQELEARITALENA
jgi:hypothetical protein